MKLNILKISALTIATAFSIAILGASTVTNAQITVQGRSEASDNPLRVKIENRLEAEGRKPMPANARVEIKDIRASTTLMKRELKASSTEMFKKIKEERKEVVKRMQKGAFEVRKSALVKQLNMALENLANIRDRIEARISQVESGEMASARSMTEAKAALVVADDKLAKAKIAVDLFASTEYTSGTSTATTTASTTVEVNLDKPRQMGDAAIKAVKDARDALKKVVQAIAKNMGVGRNNVNATTTVTATTTATTTNN